MTRIVVDACVQMTVRRHCNAIHFGTFSLADDGEHEPVAELQRALDQEKERLRFWTLDAGEARDIP